MQSPGTDVQPSIHQRMAAILAGMPAIGKDSFNPGQKFNFRSVDAILNELNPLLEKHGVFIIPRVISVETEALQPKGRVAVVTVEYRFTADDGSEIVAVSAGEGQDYGDKSLSKAMTMALKTCLGQTFAISTEDDPDGEDIQTSPAPATTQAENPAVAEAVTPAPPPPPGPGRTLEQRRAWCFSAAKELPPNAKGPFMAEMAEQGISMDFSSHTEAQVRWLEDKLMPF